MKTINQIQTKPSSRYDSFDPDQEGNKNTIFADIIIDDRSLYQMLKNMIGFLPSGGVVKSIKGK